jgi:hypothetical protein
MSPFSTIANGNIALIGNTVVTIPASNPNAMNIQNGIATPPTNPLSLDSSSYNPMAFVNTAGVTQFPAGSSPSNANSSSATLDMPAGSTVLFAGLFWGGFLKSLTTSNNYQLMRTIRLATPATDGQFDTFTDPSPTPTSPALRAPRAMSTRPLPTSPPRSRPRAMASTPSPTSGPTPPPPPSGMAAGLWLWPTRTRPTRCAA